MSAERPRSSAGYDVGTDSAARGRRAGAHPPDRRQGSRRLRDALSALRPAPPPLPVAADLKPGADRGGARRRDARGLAERRALQPDLARLDVDVRDRASQGPQGAGAPSESTGGDAALR